MEALLESKSLPDLVHRELLLEYVKEAIREILVVVAFWEEPWDVGI